MGASASRSPWVARQGHTKVFAASVTPRLLPPLAPWPGAFTQPPATLSRTGRQGIFLLPPGRAARRSSTGQVTCMSCYSTTCRARRRPNHLLSLPGPGAICDEGPVTSPPSVEEGEKNNASLLLGRGRAVAV